MTKRDPCKLLNSCGLFPLFSLKAALEVWKINYCFADYTSCARYKILVEGKRLPPTLLPNGRDLTIKDPEE